MKQKISPKLVSLIFSILVICFAIGFYILAWTEPTANPPADNVLPPLNVSDVTQSKAGGLILNTGGFPNGLIVDKGNVGIGTTNPETKATGSGYLDAKDVWLRDAGDGAGGWASEGSARYDSGWFAVTRNTLYTKAHGLGSVPFMAQLWISNTSDGSGDVLPAPHGRQYIYGMVIVDIDATNIRIRGQSLIYDYVDANGAVRSSSSGYARIKAIE